MKITTALLVFAGLATAFPSFAMDLKESKVTQVINDVDIIAGPDQKAKPAVLDDIFSVPDILRTGDDSRAELTAQDETITRVGANTIFSFDPANRTIDLKQGSLLFHSPHGKGGGTIRTGSATASVLGTTLIVTTTHDGGMKVLDLEGKVEVNFENKKRQKLNPGQMTFILPGANQLAPVIVFRLDELVKHSLLVHGFSKPLASMPLIQTQIQHQDKLIKSGRARDTGLLVGDSATPNQVEVLDPNTIQNEVYNPGANTALRVNAKIASSSLTDSRIPVPPDRLFLNSPFSLSGNHYFAGRRFRGFAGQNVAFDSGGLLTMDLAAFSRYPEFDFVAAKIMTLANSINFTGLGPGNLLALIGGQGMAFAPGISLTANVGNFEIATAGSLSMDTVSVLNNVGAINLSSGSTIDLKDVNLSAYGTTTLSAPAAINIVRSTSILLGKTGLYDNNVLLTDPNSGRINMSTSGKLTVNSTSFQTHYLTLNSGDSILLDCSGQYLKASGPGATAAFTAPNLVTARNSDFSAFGTVNMAANTINLFNVAFGDGLVTLKSLNGILAPNPNTGATSIPGDVNFIQNVTYKGSPAQNYVNNGGGITVTTLH